MMHYVANQLLAVKRILRDGNRSQHLIRMHNILLKWRDEKSIIGTDLAEYFDCLNSYKQYESSLPGCVDRLARNLLPAGIAAAIIKGITGGTKEAVTHIVKEKILDTHYQDNE